MSSNSAEVPLSGIRLAVFDVDGVLTNGALYYGAEGEQLKGFNARDGLGMKLLQAAGIEVGVISARSSQALATRLRELGIRHVRLGESGKRRALSAMAEELGIPLGQVAFMGDDLIDLPALGVAGVSAAVADAHELVRAGATWVAKARGGEGAVREFAEALIRARVPSFEAFIHAYVDGRGAPPEPKFSVVIPARYASSRLPGKPLVDLDGKLMIERVVENALSSGAERVIVATDDARVAKAVEGFGGQCQMTRSDHTSGTDRLWEVADVCGWAPEHIVVNLQGDEPLVPGALLSSVASALTRDTRVGMATLATPIRIAADVFDPNVVKVVLDDRGWARYFSRAPIPWAREVFGKGEVVSLPEGAPFFRHLGIYGYRVDTLRRLATASPSAIEMLESLEQLRALSLGIEIHTTVIQEAPGHGVDVPADVERVIRLLQQRATSKG